jgi:hypothetical protein
VEVSYIVEVSFIGGGYLNSRHLINTGTGMTSKIGFQLRFSNILK